jgi:hypothetical protein
VPARYPYSAKLHLEHAVSDTTITVPETDLWVVRTITAFFPSLNFASYVQLVDVSSGATLVKIAGSDLGLRASSISNDLRIVLNPGDSLQILGAEVVGFDQPDVGLYGYAFVLPTT